MQPRAIARTLAGGRVAVGVALLAAPERLTEPWIGRDGTRPGVRVLGRAVGARDLALGAGALVRSSDPQLRTWLLAGVAADLTDCLATVTAGPAVPLRGRALVGAIALGGAMLGAAAFSGLDADPGGRCQTEWDNRGATSSQG